MDNISKKKRSKTMSRIKSKNTKLETLFRNILKNAGFKFRNNVSTMPGKPDIVMIKYNLVIFLDSCFWHHCPSHFRMPKSNINYWKPKIANNVKQDIRITKLYKSLRWKVLRLWEHEITKNAASKLLYKVKKNIK